MFLMLVSKQKPALVKLDFFFVGGEFRRAIESHFSSLETT